MENHKKKNTLSRTYRFIRFLGINLSEADYGDISLGKAIRRTFDEIWNSLLLKYCMYSALLAPLNYRIIRHKVKARIRSLLAYILQTSDFKYCCKRSGVRITAIYHNKS